MKEFKKFLQQGNVLDMAVGLIMATYFGAIIKSLVDDIIMPPIGKLLGGVDFNELKYIIQPGTSESAPGAGDGIAEIAIRYGSFLNHIIVFIIVAFAIFRIVKMYNKMKERMPKEEEAPAGPSNEEVLLSEIRDLLKK